VKSEAGHRARDTITNNSLDIAVEGADKMLSHSRILQTEYTLGDIIVY